jgi:(R,R)-butanediol dehydrogenase/meso-butanediol dehydrogenase/diacetyl reductase
LRAAVFEGIGRPLALTSLPDPSPGPGELVLRVRSAGICGTDLHMSESPGLPGGSVLGHEFAGDVVEVGAGVDGWQRGDPACALPCIGCGRCPACVAGDVTACVQLRSIGLGDLPGAYAELVRVGAREALHLPEAVDHDGGALVEPLAVGIHALRAAALSPGDAVLVLGSGPIGLAAATWARHLGAADVVVADRVAGRLALAAAFGATATLDMADPGASVAVADLCGGPPDVVVECVGRPGMLEECLGYVRRRGRIVIAGACMAPDTVVPAMASLKEVEVRFVMAYSRQDYALALRQLAAGRVAGPAMITDRVSLDAFPAAFDALRRPTTQCKVMLRP